MDEIHRLNRQVEEVLYPAMEDFALYIIIGKGPYAKSIRLDLKKFKLICDIDERRFYPVVIRAETVKHHLLGYVVIQDRELIAPEYQ